jgi:hypothetical protein
MSDTYTQLNVGVGGDFMDEEEVTYPLSDPPTIRKRPRIVLYGVNEGELLAYLSSPPVGDELALVVRSIPSGIQATSLPGTPFNLWQQVSLVPQGTETTIISHTVSAGSSLYLLGFVASGSAAGLYRVYIGTPPFVFPTSVVLSGRASTAMPTINLDFKTAVQVVSPGQTVAVRVTHYAPSGADFEGNIIGYTM